MGNLFFILLEMNHLESIENKQTCANWTPWRYRLFITMDTTTAMEIEIEISTNVPKLTKNHLKIESLMDKKFLVPWKSRLEAILP